MKLWKKWKLRRSIISDVRNKVVTADALRRYIKYISLYDTNVVDECAVYCNTNPITGVHTLIIEGRIDVNIEVSVLGSSIMLKVYMKDERNTIERSFGFSKEIAYNNLVEKPIVDCSDTLNDVVYILCNSILYTVKNYTKRWWKNE